MAQLFGVIGALAGVSLGAAWWTAEIDVREDPPAVVCPGGWVTACERVPGGLELTVHEAPDLLFSFEGLSSEPILGYAVRCAASPEPLGLGEGTFVPLSAWPQAETVTFYALSGELDWAEVSAVAAASADGTVEGESPQRAPRSVLGRPATAVALATGGSDAEFVEGGFRVIMTPTSECGGEHELFGLWPYGGEAWTDSFEFEFEDRYWEDPQNAFTLDIEGTLKLDYPAFVTFQIAADDSAEFHVGHLTFSANGDDGEGGVYHEGVAVSGWHSSKWTTRRLRCLGLEESR